MTLDPKALDTEVWQDGQLIKKVIFHHVGPVSFGFICASHHYKAVVKQLAAQGTAVLVIPDVSDTVGAQGFKIPIQDLTTNLGAQAFNLLDDES
jgi:hypothetical protein